MEVKRDSLEVRYMATKKERLTAVCQISVIDRKEYYTNIAIQKITFKHRGKTYEMNHVWLQQRDYPKAMKDKAERYAWYEVEFEFYAYHDKITTNELGSKMHGMKVFSMKKINK